MDKKGSDFRGITRRIKQVVLAAAPRVSAVKRFAFAPTAAADQNRRGAGGGLRLHSEVSSVRNKLSVYAIDYFQREFDLKW